MTADTLAAPIPRDRYGRYLIAPETPGKPVGYTRATTIASTLDDKHSLENWKLRTLATGLATRHDIYQLIASTDPNDKTTLDRLCTDALEAGAASSGANLGSALHAFTEQADRGETVQPPPPLDKDLAAYISTIANNHVTILTDHIEQIVIHDTLKIAGTYDRIVRLPDGRTVVADLKTGQNLDYSWRAIAIQLAIYANAEHIYHPQLGRRTNLPDQLDPTVGLVIHLPAGQASCTLHLVDLVAGWEAAELAIQVREWRKTRGLDSTYQYNDDEPAPAGIRSALIARIEILRDHDALGMLAARWPAEVPTLKQSDEHTTAQLAQIAAAVADVETEASIPF